MINVANFLFHPEVDIFFVISKKYGDSDTLEKFGGGDFLTTSQMSINRLIRDIVISV